MRPDAHNSVPPRQNSTLCLVYVGASAGFGIGAIDRNGVRCKPLGSEALRARAFRAETLRGLQEGWRSAGMRALSMTLQHVLAGRQLSRKVTPGGWGWGKRGMMLRACPPFTRPEASHCRPPGSRRE